METKRNLVFGNKILDDYAENKFYYKTKDTLCINKTRKLPFIEFLTVFNPGDYLKFIKGKVWEVKKSKEK